MVRGPRKTGAGFTLIELLIVVALMGVLAALLIPNANPAIHDQLLAAAQIVAGDVGYVRSLAVMNNSSYRFTFDPTGNRYTIQHSGSRASLNALPASLFENPTNPPATQYVVDFDELPHVGPTVRLYAAGTLSLGSISRISRMDIGPLGGLVPSQDVYFWLTAGNGTSQRYISVKVNGATGLATVGDYGGSPPAVAMVASPTL